MKAAEIVKTIRSGALRIDIRRYKRKYFGFDWNNDGERKQILLLNQADAEQRARDLLGITQAGTIDLLKIDPDEYAEFLRWKAEYRQKVPVPEVVARFLASKEGKGRSAKTMRGLRHTLTRFAESFPCPIHQLNRLGVEAWLDRQGVGARRWNNLLSDIIALIRFARRDGAIAAEMTTVEKIERKKVVVTVKTYTPEELAKLLKAANRDWRPAIVLGAFCGLRPEEIAPEGRNDKPGLDWSNILWDKAKVDVPAEVSKTRRRRFAPLPAAALAWLKPYRKATGPVAPVDQRFCHYLPWLTKFSGVAWQADALRHSFASYRLALTKDMPALTLEMGNSAAMIFRHYLDLKHEPEAEAWFGVMPVNACEFPTFKKRAYRVKSSARGGT